MIRFRDANSFAVIEPRIWHLKEEIQRLLSLVELEKDGKLVAVNGFRLRHVPDWLDYSTNTAMNALTPISGVCNSKCSFCFEEGIPFPREQSLMSMAETRTRLKYYDPETGRALFPSNRPHMETFIHPQAVEIIKLAREREPGKLFWITTNGSHFDEPTIERLAALKPLIFKLSLNAADPTLNQELMRTGRRTQIALRAPALLQKYRIPFMGSIVAWPTMSLESIVDTVRYLERYQAYAIRIRLPLTHRWLKQQLVEDFHVHWRRIAALGHELRSQVSVPLFVEPPVYWVNPIIPEVDGVVLNSPAYRAGVRPTDRICEINSKTVHTRIESEAILDTCHLAGQDVDLIVERNGQRIAMQLPLNGEPDLDTYPYNSHCFYRGENYGIFHVEDFRLRYIHDMFEVIDRYQAENVMLFSSAVVAPVFETLVNTIPEFAERLARVTIYVETVEENTAGGNYDVMDSRFVKDYAAVIRRRLAQGIPIDLILIPDAFGSPWGMDMTGASYADIALEFGVPLERIEWLMVFGREV